MIRSSKGTKEPGKTNTTQSAKLFHNLCQVDPQGSAWHPPFSGDNPLSGAALKWIAIFTMLLDHIGAAILLFVFRAQGRQEPLNTIYDVLRDVGRIAFPLFIFLLTEGLAHSRNAGRYLLRLFIFALVSEVPFDLAFYGVFPYWDKQNVFFTLLLGLAAICCMDRIRKGAAPHLKGTVRVVYVAMLSLGLILTATLLAFLLNTDYSGLGILAICAMYLLRMHPLAGTTVCCGILVFSSLREFYALGSLIPISLYNGKRGRQPRWFFYIFYPAHLLLLYLIRRMLLG